MTSSSDAIVGNSGIKRHPTAAPAIKLAGSVVASGVKLAGDREMVHVV